MEVLLGESYMSASGSGLYCPHRLKFSCLFYPGSLIKKSVWETLSSLGTLWGKAKGSLSGHTPSSLGLSQLSYAVSVWALLQWQPCLCLDRHPVDLDPDHNLQTWFCRFHLGPASSQGTCLAIYTLGWPWALSPGLPYTHTGVHPVPFKALLLACLVVTLRFQAVISLLVLPNVQQLNRICHHIQYLCSLPQNQETWILTKITRNGARNLTGIKYFAVYTPSPKGH